MKTLQIHPNDNVAVVLEGDLRGHKLALRDIACGEEIVKYGYPIGHATEDIKKDQQVHSSNLKTGLGDLLSYTYTPNFEPLAPTAPRTFQGYVRKNGKVGVRNHIYIIPTVGCVNGIAAAIEKAATPFLKDGVDGIITFAHNYGCSQLGEDHKNTQKALAGLVHHPNAGGVLVLGLGCENNTMEQFRAVLGPCDEERVKFLVAQDCEDEVEIGTELVKTLIEQASHDRRETVSADKLVVGLKCGGSDGFSGITANPLVGRFSDLLIAQGGSTILTEVPEMFGAETILMNRCKDEETFHRLVSLINDFKQYFIRYNQVVYENPSPGNKAGGITTLEEKSLGCTQKGGTAPVEDVISYGEPVKAKGLTLLQAPGNDLVASTALAVSGAQIVLFTTGRGTPFGSPVPTVKISSNTALADKKKTWIDFNAGDIVDQDADLGDKGEALLSYVLALASGQVQTKSEQANIFDFAIFKDGVTL